MPSTTLPARSEPATPNSIPVDATQLAARALASEIERKDRYTGGHVKRVAHYAVRIARQIEGLSDERIERVRIAAILHDVGKIGIDDRILKKEAALDEAEHQVMRTHPELGFEILGRFAALGTAFQDVVDGMRFHHERWDGTGYPSGLQGQGIPLAARIVAVADAYDAMVSSRPYRAGIGPRAAREEILRGRGTQFDPVIVDAFFRAFTLPDIEV